MTVRDLRNRYLTGKQHLLDNGELSPRTFQVITLLAKEIVGLFGKRQLVDDLATVDFEQLRPALAKTRGPVSLGNEIQRPRGVFKYACDEGLIEKSIPFSQSIRKPSRKTLRLERADTCLTSAASRRRKSCRPREQPAVAGWWRADEANVRI